TEIDRQATDILQKRAKDRGVSAEELLADPAERESARLEASEKLSAARSSGVSGGRGAGGGMQVMVAQAQMGDPSLMQKLPRTGPARKQYEETLAKTLKESEGGIEGGISRMIMNQVRMTEARSAASTAGRVTMNTELYATEAA